MQAGLGGGSADAAAALVALARLWKVPVRPSQLTDVAGTIGADVPFFLSGGTALALGRGDEIYPLVDLSRHWVVLLTPRFGVSTVEAYGWYDADRAAGTLAAPEPQFVPGPWPSRSAQMVNDLEPPVAQRHPEIVEIRALLTRAGAVAASMSGSGSSVFGLFQRRSAALKAVAAAAARGWAAVATESMGRAEYARATRPRTRPRL
jgi:4-diphosphocytidyl-2-C-methyl-D-erythritol kinase